MTAAVLPQFVLLPSELLRCVFLLIADFGKYQVNRLKRIHFSSLDCQDFSPRVHPSPRRQREKESSCPSPKKQSGNSCGAPSHCQPSPYLAVSADVLEETLKAWSQKRSLWQISHYDVHGSGWQQRLMHWVLPSWSFSMSQQHHKDGSPSALPWFCYCLLSLCWRETSCLSSAEGGLMGQGFTEHQNHSWFWWPKKGVLITG